MKSTIPEQTIIQHIQPECDTLHMKMKAEKEKQRKTNQNIADATGIPLSNIGKFFSGFLSNPNIFYVAALAIELNMSLDELMGIQAGKYIDLPSDQQKELEIKAHDLEIHLDYARKERDSLQKLADLRAKIIGFLLGISTLLIVFIITYIIIDTKSPEMGLFRAESSNTLGIFLIILTALAVLAVIAVLIHVFSGRKERDNG